jgi:hypothetical protein
MERTVRSGNPMEDIMFKQEMANNGLFKQGAGGFFLEGSWFVIEGKPPGRRPSHMLARMLGMLRSLKPGRRQELPAFG